MDLNLFNILLNKIVIVIPLTGTHLRNQLPRPKPCGYLLRKYPTAKSSGELNPIMINQKHPWGKSSDDLILQIPFFYTKKLHYYLRY